MKSLYLWCEGDLTRIHGTHVGWWHLTSYVMRTLRGIVKQAISQVSAEGFPADVVERCQARAEATRTLRLELDKGVTKAASETCP